MHEVIHIISLILRFIGILLIGMSFICFVHTVFRHDNRLYNFFFGIISITSGVVFYILSLHD